MAAAEASLPTIVSPQTQEEAQAIPVVPEPVPEPEHAPQANLEESSVAKSPEDAQAQAAAALDEPASATAPGTEPADVSVTQEGASAGDESSLKSRATGQVPSSSSSLAQPSSGQAPATMTPVEPQLPPEAASQGSKEPEAEKEKDTETENEKDKGSWNATTITTPVRKRRRDGKSASDGEHTASTASERPSSSHSNADAAHKPKRARKSILARFALLCSSCVRPSPRAHEVDVGEGASPSQKKPSGKEKENPQTSTVSSTTTTVNAPVVQPLTIPAAALPDTEIIIPPTPTKQLLPFSETDGLTSGAVQPPGSTGEDLAHEPIHVHRDSGEESDGSYSEDDVLRELVTADDDEDEERALIRKGGVGIPIGPDGTPQPLLPPISPKHIGRKCLVLDLDETLVHSSLRAVPSPDYIVPVEIESYWHNFYVLKRPGVDSFLQEMGKLYEVVVFTASLAKYADPVLDRLDPDHSSVAHRLFRESCYNHRGNYVKDLSQLGRPIGDTIILDNSPASYIFHPHNAVPVSSWFNDPHDTELTDLCPFLSDLVHVDDVRGILNPNSQ